MLNGIFGKWLREFATLVLTQTVQAFLLAIVMTVIISCLGNADDAATGNQAAGLLAIIALASFGKIEMLVKNIFGVTSQFGDPSLQNGARGLSAASLLAMRGGKRLLDNGTKMIDSQRKISEAKKGLAAMDERDNNSGLTATTNPSFGSGNPEKTSIDTKGEDNDKTETTTSTSGNGDLLETTLKIQGLEDISSLTTAINRLASQAEKNNGGSDRQKYEDMLKEGKDLRRSAIRENVGAMIGGTAGAIVGLAQGDNVIENTLAGAGAGDAIGQMTSDRKAKRIDYNNRSQKYEEKIKDLTEEQYEKNMKALVESMEKQGLGGGITGIKNKAKFEIKNAPIGSATLNNASTAKKINKDYNNTRRAMQDKKTVEPNNGK